MSNLKYYIVLLTVAVLGCNSNDSIKVLNPSAKNEFDSSILNIRPTVIHFIGNGCFYHSNYKVELRSRENVYYATVISHPNPDKASTSFTKTINIDLFSKMEKFIDKCEKINTKLEGGVFGIISTTTFEITIQRGFFSQTIFAQGSEIPNEFEDLIKQISPPPIII